MYIYIYIYLALCFCVICDRAPFRVTALFEITSAERLFWIGTTWETFFLILFQCILMRKLRRIINDLVSNCLSKFVFSYEAERLNFFLAKGVPKAERLEFIYIYIYTYTIDRYMSNNLYYRHVQK